MELLLRGGSGEALGVLRFTITGWCDSPFSADSTSGAIVYSIKFTDDFLSIELALVFLSADTGLNGVGEL